MREASTPAEATIRLPILHPGQRAVLAGARRFNVLCCGRRWGKSLFGLDRLIDSPRVGILDGQPCGWFAATTKLADEFWALAQRVLAPVTLRCDGRHRRIETTTGGSLEVWSLESAGVGLGRRYGVVGIDEAAIARDLRERFMREIRPTLSDLAPLGSSAWILGTPRGRLGDFFELHQRGVQDGSWASFIMPTASNPHISAAEIAAARAEYLAMGRPDLFQQEYLAEFVVSSGVIFKPELIQHGTPPRIEHLYVGIDPALTASAIGAGDETAMVVMGRDAQDRWWIVDVVHGRWAPDQVGEHAMALCERHDPNVVWLEGGPAGLGVRPWLVRCMDDARRHWRLDMMSHLREKAAKAATAAGLCNTGKLWVPTGAAWWPRLRDQLAVFDGNGAEHDDLVDALGIVARGCRSMMPTREPAVVAAEMPMRAGNRMLPRVEVERGERGRTGIRRSLG